MPTPGADRGVERRAEGQPGEGLESHKERAGRGSQVTGLPQAGASVDGHVHGQQRPEAAEDGASELLTLPLLRGPNV